MEILYHAFHSIHKEYNDNEIGDKTYYVSRKSKNDLILMIKTYCSISPHWLVIKGEKILVKDSDTEEIIYF